MKITLEIDEEIQEAVQNHLNGGISVQKYILCALQFFNDMKKIEESGKMVGYGEKERFKTYNKEVSPLACLRDFGQSI